MLEKERTEKNLSKNRNMHKYVEINTKYMSTLNKSTAFFISTALFGLIRTSLFSDFVI